MWAAGFMYSWKKMEVAQLALSPLRVELRHNTTTWVFDCHRTVKSMHMCFVKKSCPVHTANCTERMLVNIWTTSYTKHDKLPVEISGEGHGGIVAVPWICYGKSRTVQLN